MTSDESAALPAGGELPAERLPGPTPGQLGCVRTSRPWVSRAIQWVTHSPVNHVVVAVDAERGIEADPRGAQWVRLDRYPDARWTTLDLTRAQAGAITARARSLLGTPYGWLDCVAAGLWALGVRVPWLVRFLRSYQSLDCSQLGAVCVAAAGIELVPGQDPCTVSPGDVLLVADGFTRPAYAPTPEVPR